MTADGSHSLWVTDAIAFLSRNLPPAEEGKGWEHMFSSAYQMGCEALVALGHAEETEWGAVPREAPRLPSILPRWDDISVAVLGLAAQQGKLAYRQSDGSVLPRQAPPGWTTFGPATAPPPPNIEAIDGLGLARAKPDALSVLQSLGLIAEGRWTKAAETVLWRQRPQEWRMSFTSDPRFTGAAQRALNAIPNDVQAEMDRIVTIPEAEVLAAAARGAAANRKKRAKHGPNALLLDPETPEQARRRLEFWRRHEFDWLFFRRWRLPDGWLTLKEAERALEIFHDPLAIEMRRAIARRLYPELLFLADRL